MQRINKSTVGCRNQLLQCTIFVISINNLGTGKTASLHWQKIANLFKAAADTEICCVFLLFAKQKKNAFYLKCQNRLKGGEVGYLDEFEF